MRTKVYYFKERALECGDYVWTLNSKCIQQQKCKYPCHLVFTLIYSILPLSKTQHGCYFFFCRKMGTYVANKSRNPLVFVTVRVRQLIPFHVLYSTITPSTASSSNGREYLEIPYQNRNQLLKSMRDHCKSRTFRNLDHALVLFDKMLHFKPFAFPCGFYSIFWCHCKYVAFLSSHYSNWTNGIIRNCSQ